MATSTKTIKNIYYATSKGRTDSWWETITFYSEFDQEYFIFHKKNGWHGLKDFMCSPMILVTLDYTRNQIEKAIDAPLSSLLVQYFSLKEEFKQYYHLTRRTRINRRGMLDIMGKRITATEPRYLETGRGNGCETCDTYRVIYEGLVY